ncbi:amino acid ABC transporter substrate-binding protein [Kiloniella sp. b19]|uniref:amino acid ABC transporter substrate-binding protein n=1 Tax=Kiloniella sp. GXU_MW_B19 TaxID=3141326 RepID=UPI0031DC8998
MGFKTLLTASALAVVASATASAGTLDDVKAKGYVQCGVNQGAPGLSNPDDQGNWTGLDVDFCRAMAAAIFDDPQKVNFSPLSGKTRFTALSSGEIDVLSRNTTWTMSRDVGLGLEFVGVNFYDGQGFLVREDLGVSSALELSGAAVCTSTGTTTELNVTDYFRANSMELSLVAFEKEDEVIAAYDAGRCDVYTTDVSGIAAHRTKLNDSAAHIILPEIISKEPLGPVVREGDAQWINLARWTLNAMINAEELGVSSANVDEMLKSENPSIQRLLGVTGELGSSLGLSNDFAYRIIKQVGNYGESYERNVGENTPIGLPRGLNALWNQGGVLYAPPVR